MRTGIWITAFAIMVLNAADLFAAQVLSGKWSGKSPTTLEFLDGNKVKYCYKKKCTVQPFTGDRATEVKFKWGRSKFVFTKTETGYDGSFLRVITSKVKVQ